MFIQFIVFFGLVLLSEWKQGLAQGKLRMSFNYTSMQQEDVIIDSDEDDHRNNAEDVDVRREVCFASFLHSSCLHNCCLLHNFHALVCTVENNSGYAHE